MYADPGGVAAFASRADTPFGTVGSLVMLGGMWNADTVPKAYGGPWSAIWLAVVLAALAGYVLIGCRRPRREQGREPGRWPGLTAAALVSLAIACIGITEPGRALLRGAIRGWPAFAILRDAQQFIAPLALAEAIGFGLAVTWCVRPRPFGQKFDNERGTITPPSPPKPDPPDPLGLALGVLALLTPLLLLPGLAWGAAGRLRPAWYPASFLAAARAIDASPAPGRRAAALGHGPDPGAEPRRGDARRLAPGWCRARSSGMTAPRWGTSPSPLTTPRPGALTASSSRAAR